MENYLTVSHNGKQYVNYTEAQLLSAGVPQEIVDAEKARLHAIQVRNTLRSTIGKEVGDAESLLGTVSDAVGLLTVIALADIAALGASNDFASYKKKKLDTLKALAGDVDLAALAGAALGKVQSGDVILTASLKGLPAVLDETLSRSTAVSTILARAMQTKEGQS